MAFLDEPARYVPINPLTPNNFSGRSLRILSYLTNTKIGDWFINPMVLKVLGIARFRTLNLNEYQGLFHNETFSSDQFILLFIYKLYKIDIIRNK